MDKITQQLISSENIGLEVECPFHFYYPELFQKYLSGRSYTQLSDTEKTAFTTDIEKTEPALFEKLTRVSQELGLGKGKDPYWEFIFPATKTLHTHISDVQTLIAENLLPADEPLSLHMTVGSISRERAFALLVFLEKKFVTKQRILEALNQKDYLATWGRKGKGGIVYKGPVELMHGDNKAYELRTLKIAMNQLPDCLTTCKQLLDTNENQLVRDAKQELEAIGLPRKSRGRKEIEHYGMNGKFAI